MSRTIDIYFKRVGETRTGRRLYKLCGKDGKTFGRAFCIGKRKRKKPTTPSTSEGEEQ